MHEINPFPEALVGIVDGSAHERRNEPLFGFGFLGKERLVGDSATDVNANTDTILLAEGGQSAGVFKLFLFSIETVRLVKVDDGHGDTEILEFGDGFFGVFPDVVILLPNGVISDTATENSHAVPVADNDQWLLFQPGRPG